MNFFSRNAPQAYQQIMNMPIQTMGGGNIRSGMFGFGGSRFTPVQQQQMPTALPVAHSATQIGQHPMGPQGTIPTGPQGFHPTAPQGQALEAQRQAEIVAAQQAQANQPTLASMLRMGSNRFGRFGGFGGGE